MNDTRRKRSTLSRKLILQMWVFIAGWTMIVLLSLTWNLHGHEFIMATETQFKTTVIVGHLILWLLVLGGIFAVGSQWRNIQKLGREMNRKLRQSEARQRALLEAIPDLLLTINREGVYVDVEGRNSPDLLRPADELVGRNLFDVLPPDVAQERLALIEQVLQTGQSVVFDYQLPGEGGIKYREGRIVKSDDETVLFITRDVTHRKQAEAEIRRLKEFNEAIIEHMAEGIVVQDSDGHLSFVNPAAAEMLGYTVEALTGQHWTAVVPPDQRAIVQEADQRREQGQADRYELELLRQDGTRISTLTSGSPLYREGEFIGTLAVFTDIGTLKEAQEEMGAINTELESALLRANELAILAEQANVAKSEFLANMSHEIRTPMNGIIGMTDLALGTDLTTEQRDYLTAVSTSADALLRLINDILDFSKIEAGHLDLEVIDFDLRETVEQLADIMAQRAAEKHLELLLHIHPDVPVAVQGDSLRLRQILVNLVGNALKFTEQGEIVVAVQVQQKLAEAVQLHFSVSDTGVGIPPEKCTLIFQQFSQADGSITRKYGGTGLGLTISKQLVGLMRGRIWVESEVGKGSVFQFTVQLPLGQTPSKPVDSSHISIDGLRVLAVDDNATNLRILHDLLQPAGCRYREAQDGPTALSMLQKALEAGQPYDLMLLDVQMPEMGGLDVLEHLQSIPQLQSMPVILLTSVDNIRRIAGEKAVNWTAYLTKPIKQATLFDTIKQVLSQNEPDELAADIQLADASSATPPLSLRLLLVEDNQINRRLAKALLEREGHQLVMAGNGLEALECLERDSQFDIILMDVQMPEMDGMEATRRIRAEERWAHIPIIAMTAHAMSGDRERFLAVGMDDYVTKPIRKAAVLAALERQSKSIGRKPKPGLGRDNGVSGGEKAAPILDPTNALEWLDGDTEVYQELITLFVDETASDIAQLGEAIAGNDTANVEQVAHKLKGAAANLGALRFSSVAYELENMGRTRMLGEAQEAFARLQQELQQVANRINEPIGSE